VLTKAVRFLLLTEGFAVATFAVGWWGVAVLALFWALVTESIRRPVRFATICAAAGWGSLLLLDAVRGPIGELASRFGGVMGVPPVALIAITLIFPALLAWSAASIGLALRRMIPRSRGERADAAVEPVPSGSGGGVAIADV